MGLLDEIKERIIKTTNESVVDKDGNLIVNLCRGMDYISMLEEGKKSYGDGEG